MGAPPPTTPLDEWVWTATTRDGTPITIRPLRKDDEQREIAFVNSLSERSRYFRLFTPLKYLPPQMLHQFMDVDYDRRMALVATVGTGDQEEFIGVARYGPTDQSDQAELGVTVTDAWQRRGIAAILVRALMRFAAAHGFREITGVVLPENYAMIELARSLGFTTHMDAAAHVIRISRKLPSDSEAPAEGAPEGGH
ncbi:MAG TPA: GNAT family N-acetyltransferase [Steroidobacter sp.]|uniref:GNAT family N-acetyltransferase n=1 Tax=Steroidobacter sp. TaxID=1978227 RepID=UPI002EDA63C3